MPYVTVNGCEYFVKDTEEGPETIVFGHGYLMTHRLFDAQVDALSDSYRCIAFDWRGQGMTQITTGGYDVRDLARDVASLLDAMDVDRCHYVGLSMGGFVGFRLLAHYGDRLHSAVLLDSDAGAESMLRWLKYQAMLTMVEHFGYDSVIDRVIPLMFGETFRREQPEAVEMWTERITAQDPRGIVPAGRGIFSRESALPLLGKARTPTLLMVGGEDVTTPPEKTAAAHDALPNSKMLIVPQAGHSSAVEQPEAVTHAIRRFLAEDISVPS
ncbi:alpha/beta fold hydrolase [Longibacter salinarum]|nr:alpha/beta fold hydrolase [Longibacter salinarum]